MTPDITNLTEVLTWLAAGGGAAVAGWLLSLLAERVPQFGALDAGIKRVLMIVLSGLLGVVAWAIMTYVSPEQLAALAPAFGAFMLSAAAAGSNQLAHAVGKLLSQRNSA